MNKVAAPTATVPARGFPGGFSFFLENISTLVGERGSRIIPRQSMQAFRRAPRRGPLSAV